ncbi:carbohydrate kinase family protein [Roseinatronobacter alkalisoli]|uniref:Carbohydrate kinase family protein n=1 Tax=Roseinatronobacter alkalisoli TaxID=3028235 RepID=A0ABT5TA82_9RHOB|nr:carbohydrate kinase family protein [Roseinatronobacter sp. HJB301]MDD7972029.1 carbohydrate kinase family protein [Roseinatronobacter sp. HJB301]
MTGRRGVACAGNWILDIVHDISAWPEKSELVRILGQTSGLGGGAANVAANLVAMGANYPVVPIGLIGTDFIGDEVLAHCKAAGLDTARIVQTEAAATSQSHVMNLPGDSRTFFYHPGANDLLSSAHIDVDALAASYLRILYIGYINLLAGLDKTGPNGRPVAADVLADARSAGIMTCIDLVSSHSATYHDTVFGVLPEVDILFLNEVEAARATGLAINGETDDAGMIRAAKALADGGVRRAVIMHSAARVVWMEAGDAMIHVPQKVPAANILSPVGAGDAFAAGVIHGLHEGWSRDAAINLGCRAARACLGAQTATGGLGRDLLHPPPTDQT